ncbi:hypothetical protein AB1Y20_007431 [Prymnesium parvum]|uniref:Uncharacterized protein n=1 Tax=Prymnesium parvum TaxID=97485 RepID=A0AB34IX30_PRYPA
MFRVMRSNHDHIDEVMVDDAWRAMKRSRRHGQVGLHLLRLLTVKLVDRHSSIPLAWRRVLSRPCSAYALSSLLFCLAGVVEFAQCAACAPASPAGFSAKSGVLEAVLVFQQGILSYWSDVLRVGQVSWAHPLDRLSAVSLTGFQLVKICYLVFHSLAWIEIIWLVGGLLTGLSYKVADYYALLDDDALRYRRTHMLWHVSLPLVFVSHTLARWYLLSEQC